MKLSTALLCACLCVLPGAASAAPIAPASVSSDYRAVDIATQNGCYAPGTYASGSALGVCHDLWVNPAPAGDWVFMNGDDDASDQVAYRMVYNNLAAATDYTFSSMVANVCCNFDSGFIGPLLSWYVNGVRWLDVQTDGPGVGETFGGVINTGNASVLVFELRNQRSVFDGNDFALNTSVTGLDPVPEPASIIMLGTGLFGLAAAAKRKRQGRAYWLKKTT